MPASSGFTIIESIQLPPDNRSDDIFIQRIENSTTGEKGMAIYEESRRGGFDSEHWHHRGYMLDESSYNELSLLMSMKDRKEAISRLERLYQNHFSEGEITVVWDKGFTMPSS